MVLSIVSARLAGWSAVEAVLAAEATSRDCQCQFHVLDNAEARGTDREGRTALLREQVATLDPARGLVAMDDDLPVGWVGVEPRTRLRHIVRSRLVAKSSTEPLDDPAVWAVYCILVPPKQRRRGIATALLSAAIDFAVASGSRAIEGYPIDTAKRGGKLPPGFSTGTVAMFAREGFAPVAALPSARTLMHRTI